jgi:hypothetical protein
MLDAYGSIDPTSPSSLELLSIELAQTSVSDAAANPAQNHGEYG